MVKSWKFSQSSNLPPTNVLSGSLDLRIGVNSAKTVVTWLSLFTLLFASPENRSLSILLVSNCNELSSKSSSLSTSL